MKTMLLVEDNAQQRLLVEKVMRLHSENVFSTDDAAKAGEFHDANNIDFAIIDLDTKPAERIELVRHIRKNDTGKKAYVLAGTEKGDTSDILDMLEAGANEFLAKPYGRAMLETKILLSNRRGYSGDAMGVLTEEHRAILRAVRLLNYISGKLREKNIPDKLLKWATSTSFLLDSDLHHKKEEHFIISFLDGAIKQHAEDGDSTIFSRSSLKTIENEHADLIALKKEIQVNMSVYSQVPSEENRENIRNSIRDYTVLLKDHMIREERFLFPASRPLMNENENARLLREFQKIEADIGIEKIDKRSRLLLDAERLVQRRLEDENTGR